MNFCGSAILTVLIALSRKKGMDSAKPRPL